MKAQNMRQHYLHQLDALHQKDAVTVWVGIYKVTVSVEMRVLLATELQRYVDQEEAKLVALGVELL